MAGDWIKMRLDLAEDPAVIEMADRLQVREEVVVGYCHAFWSWVSRQCHAGSVTGVTLSSLGRVLNLPGFPELLCEVGWLLYDETGSRPVISIPNFERHLSEGAKKRANDAERQKKRRHADVTKMSRSTCDKSVTREEKRREENNREENKKEEKKSLASLPLPFSSDEFRESWGMFLEMRSEIRKPMKPTAAAASLQRLREIGHDRAVRALRHTTANQWQGIREPDTYTPAKEEIGF